MKRLLHIDISVRTSVCLSEMRVTWLSVYRFSEHVSTRVLELVSTRAKALVSTRAIALVSTGAISLVSTRATALFVCDITLICVNLQL